MVMGDLNFVSLYSEIFSKSNDLLHFLLLALLNIINLLINCSVKRDYFFYKDKFKNASLYAPNKSDAHIHTFIEIKKSCYYSCWFKIKITKLINLLVKLRLICTDMYIFCHTITPLFCLNSR